MVLLKGGTHYLLLSRNPEGRHEVACHERFDRALADWKLTGTRISPIFSLNDAAVPVFKAGETRWLWFCGPVHPGTVEGLGGVSAYLSLGLYNLVLFVTDEASRERVREFVAKHKVAWEEWEILGNGIASTSYSSLVAAQPLTTRETLSPLFPKVDALCGAGREYVALLAASLARGARCTPAAARELFEFDAVFRNQLLQTPNKTTPVKQGLLAIANAALSRYTSQTYAGTSPVLESECHYYSHSLLGIGTASLALTQIRRFVGRAVETTRLTDRVQRLRHAQPAKLMLHSMPPNDSFWATDFLVGEFPKDDPAQQKFARNDDPRLHLLTYFSGRDGFRATLLSLSAPLELLESCNSITWTMLTLTHEISHILVDGVLAFLLPNPRSAQQLEQVVKLLARGDEVANLYEQLQQLLCYSVWQMASPNATDWLGPQQLGEILEGEGQSLYELVTHCFDFLYFYRGDPEVYIPALWASWSVIPNIAHRVSDYLVRSLCALYTKNVRREDGVSITLDQLVHLLQQVQQTFADALYVPQAIAELQANREQYADALSKRRPLALFVRHFLYSPEVEKHLLSGDEKNEFKALEFGDGRVINPLRFIHEFSRDPSRNHLRSAWILQQLALGGDL